MGLGKVRNEVSRLREDISRLGTRVNNISQKVEENEAKYEQFLDSMIGPQNSKTDVRKHLVFYGVELDDVRLELIKYKEYCSDILEARLRSVLFEQLNITRDIPMTKVEMTEIYLSEQYDKILYIWQVYRLESGGTDIRNKPIVASLTNQADKWEILCLARKQFFKVKL